MHNYAINELTAAKNILDAIAESKDTPTDHMAYMMAHGLADIANEVDDEEVAYQVTGISEMMFVLSERRTDIKKPEARFLSRCINNALQVVA